MTTFKTREHLEMLAVAEMSNVRASDRMELVGIGLESVDSWVILPNVARPGAFMVTGADVKDAMFAFAEEYGVGYSAVECTIWHSHFVYDVPSRADLENFPQWAKRGLLFHTPSGTTIAYGKAGVISGLGAESAVPLTREGA